MENSKANWGFIGLRIAGLIIGRTLLGALLGVCAGAIAGGICGGLCAMGIIGLFFGGSIYGPPIGLVSAAFAFAIQGLISAFSTSSLWHEKWRLSCRFLIPTTLFFSIFGGLSIALGHFLWSAFIQHQGSSMAFIEANNGFFWGSIASYCMGTLVAALAPERLERIRSAWCSWREGRKRELS